MIKYIELNKKEISAVNGGESKHYVSNFMRKIEDRVDADGLVNSALKAVGAFTAAYVGYRVVTAPFRRCFRPKLTQAQHLTCDNEELLQ